MRHNVDFCLCGNEPIVIGFYIKGVANHKNYFVKCENCKTRTRNRRTPSKAIESPNTSNLFEVGVFSSFLFFRKQWD